MEVENKLITALLKTILANNTEKMDLCISSLCRLPQVQQIITIIIANLRNASDPENKHKLSNLVLNYILLKKDQIKTFPTPVLFDIFKTIVCEFPGFDQLCDCNLAYSTIEFILPLLTSFSTESLQSSILSWGGNNTYIALYALGNLDTKLLGKCISEIIVNLSENYDALFPLIQYMKKNTVDSIGDVATIFTEEAELKIFSIISSMIRKNDVDKITSLSLLGSLCHFLPGERAISLCVDFKDSIQKLSSTGSSSVRVSAIEALIELPSSDEKLGPIPQLEVFVPSFTNGITSFDCEVADALVRFIEPRMNNPEFEDWVTHLFQNEERIECGSLICCRFPSILEKFSSYIFPSAVTSITAHSVCLSARCIKEMSNTMISMAVESICAIFGSKSIIEDMEIEKNVMPAFQQIVKASKGKEGVFILSVLNSIKKINQNDIFTEIVNTLMKMVNESNIKQIPKMNENEFILTSIPMFLRYLKAHKNDEIRNLILFVVSLLSSSLKESEIIDYHTLQNKCIAAILDELIPTENANRFHLSVLQIADIDPVANVLAVSIKSVLKNPPQIMQSMVDLDPFDETVFEQFFINAVYRNPDESLDFFVKTVTSVDFNTSESLIQKGLRYIMFYSPPGKKKFTQESVQNVIIGIAQSLPKMDQSILNKLFQLANHVFTSTDLMVEVIEVLSKPHIQCDVPEFTINSVLSGLIFASIFPDFLHVIELNDQRVTLALTTFINANERGPILESIFAKNSSTYYSPVLAQMIDASSSMENIAMTESFCKITSKTHLAESSEVALHLVDFLYVYSNEELRLAAVRSLAALYFVEEIDCQGTTSGEVNSLTTSFFNRISDAISDEVAVSLFTAMEKKQISLGRAILLSQLINKHGTSIINANPMPYILKEGDELDNPAISNVLSHILLDFGEINPNYAFKQFTSLTSFSQFANVAALAFLSKDHLSLLTDQVIKFSVKSDSDFSSGTIQLFELVALAGIGHDKDISLIWLFVFVCSKFVSSESLTSTTVRSMLKTLTVTMKAIFGRYGLTMSVDDRDLITYEGFGKKVSNLVSKLSLTDIQSFVDSIPAVKKNTPSEVIASVAVTLAHLLRLMLRYPKAKYVSVIIADKVADVSIIGRDECCRLICGILPSLFSSEQLHAFSTDQLKKLMMASLRSLIRPDEFSEQSDVIFFATLLTVVPSEIIKAEYSRALDTLTRCFKYTESVGIEILLDAVKVMVHIDPSITPFVNMSQVSLPRLLVISTDRNESIRKRATAILQKLANNENIVEGIHLLIDEQEFSTIAVFLADWMSKNKVNKYAMNLLKDFAILIKDRKLVAEKATPFLVQLISSSDELQQSAIELLSILLQ